MGSMIFVSIVLTILAFYWLPTGPALVAAAIILVLLLRTPTKRAIQRGRRIIAERGKHDEMISNFYWKESVVHALFLGAMAGSLLGSESALGAQQGGDVGGVDVGGYGDGHSGDFGGGGGGAY